MSSNDLMMSIDETVSYLARTELPTLIVEGSGDRALLRTVEARLADQEVSIHFVGGKGSVDALYARRKEFERAKVVFLRDRDEWVIHGVPSGYEDVVFTRGYSIENDVLDRAYLLQLTGARAAELVATVDRVSYWFLHALALRATGEDAVISLDLTEIVAGEAYLGAAADHIARAIVTEDFKLRCSFEKWLWLRGKTLMRIVQHHFSGESPRYGKDQICDLCIKFGQQSKFSLLLADLRAKFGDKFASGEFEF